ncbi:MAG: DUF1501 domain-containing protein [Planctomycetota bacterium]
MADSRDCRRLDPRLSNRRTFLQAGSLAAMGLGLPELLMARDLASTAASSGAGRGAAGAATNAAGRSGTGVGSGRARSCILLFATGGPAQQETFDPKPDADVAVRGEFDPIATNVPGIEICELLPRMAQNAHRYSIIRSTYHRSGTHGVGVHYNLTGLPHAPRPGGEPQVSRQDPPSIGGAIRQLRGDKGGLPGSVHLPVRIGDQNNFQWGGQHAGYLGAKYDPLMLIDEHWLPGTLPPAFLPQADVGMERFSDRVNLLRKLADGGRQLPGEEAGTYELARQRALSVLDSHSAWEAFLLDKEDPATIARYGDNKFGRSCLVARRLVEAGVSLVTVPWMHLVSTKNFDTHSNHFRLMKDLLMPPVDQAFSALLEDLDERGLLDETLVAWTGEFGRTPKINQSAGRDHWGNVYSTVLAGGGIRGGQVIGASDKSAAEPVDHPVHTRDFVATIYHALGYGRNTVVHDMGGRPRPLVEGQPIQRLF